MEYGWDINCVYSYRLSALGVCPTNEWASVKAFCTCNRPVNHKQVKVSAIAGSMWQVMASLQPSQNPRYYTNKHTTLTLSLSNNTRQQNFTFSFGTRGKISNPNRAFNAEFKYVSSFSPSPTVFLWQPSEVKLYDSAECLASWNT